MVGDASLDSTAVQAEMNPSSGNKRDGVFCDLDSTSKKLKTDNEGNQIAEASNCSNVRNEVHTTVENEEECFTVEADVAEDKGSRHTMEDAWVVLQDASLEFPGKLRCAHFAIYDGHGGRLAAEYAQKNLHRNVLSAGLPLGCQSCKKGHT